MGATGRETADAAQPGGGRVRLRLLGGAELEGRPRLRFLPERRFRLLAYLALRADWVTRDELAAQYKRPATTIKTLLRRSLTVLKECLDGQT